MAAIICERCKERPAKNFICQIIGDEKNNLSLCEECFRADHSLSSDTPIFDGSERCYYCKAPAKSGRINDEEEQRVRGERFHFTCGRCSQLYAQFVLQAMTAIPAGLSAEEQIKAYIDVISESDRLLSAKVREPKT
jgi:protein-arginine kinase activator protein McsA